MPEALSEAGLPPLAETYATGSNAASVSDLTLEQAIGVQVRQLRRASRHYRIGAGGRGRAFRRDAVENRERADLAIACQPAGLSPARLNVPLTTFFSTFEEKRDCSFVKAGSGVVIERRGTKAGHQYALLGHALGGAVVVEPYLITLHKDAAPYPAFQHEGTEFIYMLTGEVLYRHGDQSYHLTPGDALLFDSAATARAGKAAYQADDLSFDHHLRPRTGGLSLSRQASRIIVVVRTGYRPRAVLHCRKEASSP